MDLKNVKRRCLFQLSACWTCDTCTSLIGSEHEKKKMKFLLTREKENGNILEMKTFWRGENEDPFKGAHANRELIIFISTA